jgi:DeoR family fructose operon transcriptional repressor
MQNGGRNPSGVPLAVSRRNLREIMLQHQRRHRILELVRERKTCTVDELRQELGISAITIYRDLRKLDEDDLIRRVHGGVTLCDPDPVNWRFADRLTTNAAAKERIGRAVAAWVREGSAIFVDASSTTYFFAQQVAQRGIPRLTLVTNSPGVPLLFEASPRTRIISTGGELHHTLNAYGGPIAMRVLEEMNFDSAFISCAGFNVTHGATTDSPVLVELLRGVARRAREVILLIDSSKFSKMAIMTSLRASEITRIVADDRVPRDSLRRMQDAGMEITLIESGAEEQGGSEEEEPSGGMGAPDRAVTTAGNTR